MTRYLERVRRLLRRELTRAEAVAEGGRPVATPPEGSPAMGMGRRERETSTNAQMAGAADEPWSGNR